MIQSWTGSVEVFVANQGKKRGSAAVKAPVLEREQLTAR